MECMQGAGSLCSYYLSLSKFSEVRSSRVSHFFQLLLSRLLQMLCLSEVSFLSLLLLLFTVQCTKLNVNTHLSSMDKNQVCKTLKT